MYHPISSAYSYIDKGNFCDEIYTRLILSLFNSLSGFRCRFMNKSTFMNKCLGPSVRGLRYWSL